MIDKACAGYVNSHRAVSAGLRIRCMRVRGSSTCLHLNMCACKTGNIAFVLNWHGLKVLCLFGCQRHCVCGFLALHFDNNLCLESTSSLGKWCSLSPYELSDNTSDAIEFLGTSRKTSDAIEFLGTARKHLMQLSS